MRVAVLAHGKFPDRAKTAVGVLRYSDDEVVAVLDRDRAGDRVADHLSGVPDAPIVESMADVPSSVDALIIGIAPIGGGFDESWRPDVRSALQQGCDIIAGLHYFLGDDDEFAALADEYGCTLRDVRRPDADIGVSEGIANEVAADVVVTVGTDCSVGKMTTTMELVEAAEARGIDAAAIPTGQTGIMIEGWGHPVDRVVSDFAAGAVEEMILEAGNRHELLVVEGQGSVVHPAYSAVTLAILHGAMPDALVLCHVADRDSIHGYNQALPPLSTYVELYEAVAAPVRETAVTAGALNTAGLGDDAAAADAVAAYEDAIGAPASDPIRFSADAILEGVV
ncbi:MAG: DUF1611 domain-containing protein [Halobacteriaceae archaeon]